MASLFATAFAAIASVVTRRTCRLRRRVGRPIVALLALAATCAVCGSALAHSAVVAAASPDVPTWYESFLATAHQWQGDLYRNLARAVRGVRDSDSLGPTLSLLGISFLYGVLHAAGPGHGKAVISAYLVAEERTLKRGVGLAFLSAGAQGVTAVLVVGILAAVFGLISREVANIAMVLERASYALIAGVGGYLLWRTATEIWSARQGVLRHAHECHGHDHHHHHHHHHHNSDTRIAGTDTLDWRRSAAVIGAIGIRPCTGAILVLLFALAQGVFFVGVLATAAMALGTAITVSALAVISVVARKAALHVAEGMDGWLLWTYWGLSLAGSLALLVMGVVLFFGPSDAALPGIG